MRPNGMKKTPHGRSEHVIVFEEMGSNIQTHLEVDSALVHLQDIGM